MSAIAERVAKRYANLGVRNLRIFDFDGTLFSSPGSEKSGWWDKPESLLPPNVPEKPDTSWYLQPALGDLRASLGAPGIHAVVCTGRKESFRGRIQQILSNAGVRPELFLNPGKVTARYKVETLRYLAKMLPGLQQVEVWEDNKENLRHLEKAAHNLGLRFVGHYKKHPERKA